MTKLSIATWNVNSIRARLEVLLKWIKLKKPDILLLQELKAQEDNIPREEIEDLNYNFITYGQKAYNGVAILSKFPVSDITFNLPNFKEDIQARYIEAFINIADKGIRIGSIYAPNGNPLDTDKYYYKIQWLEKLYDHAKKLLEYEEYTILGGDFNICPTNLDAADESLLSNDAIYTKDVKSLFRRTINLGYYDVFRSMNPENQGFTYWDYGQSFKNDIGVRIDHFLMSPYALDAVKRAYVDKEPRAWQKPSDHTPLLVEMEL